MAYLIHHKKGTLTPSSGSAQATFQTQYGIIRQIIVQASTGSTTFDVNITDSNDYETYEDENILGKLNDLPDIPCYGPITLGISNASADEEFTYLLQIQERWSKL